MYPSYEYINFPFAQPYGHAGSRTHLGKAFKYRQRHVTTNKSTNAPLMKIAYSFYPVSLYWNRVASQWTKNKFSLAQQLSYAFQKLIMPVWIQSSLFKMRYFLSLIIRYREGMDVHLLMGNKLIIDQFICQVVTASKWHMYGSCWKFESYLPLQPDVKLI